MRFLAIMCCAKEEPLHSRANKINRNGEIAHTNKNKLNQKDKL